MTSTLPRLLRLLGLCGIIAAAITLPIIPTARAETNAPNDTPTPVVVQTVDDWAIGSGLIYWGQDCFAVEFGRAGYLRRQPLAGGTQRTLETTDGSHCDMPFGMSAQEDGAYYTDLSEKRLERTPPSEPYTGQPVATPVEADLPAAFAQLEVTASHIYWPVYSGGKILRAARAGGAIETVANGLTNPLDVMVVGNTVYWTENSGVWTISTDCATLPCTATKKQFATFPANTTGNSLFYRRGNSVGSYTIYWVQRTVSGGTPSSAIRAISCNGFAICPFPGSIPSTVYSAGNDWEVGGLASDGASLFWSEAYNKASILNGNVKRKALSGGDAADIAVNQTYIDVRKMFIAGGNLYFARLAGAGVASGIYSLPLNASAILRDLSADALEVTQAIQNLANSAPLAAKKTTFVRAYAKELSGPNSPTVEARLVGKRNGLDLPGSPLAALNGTRSLTAGGVYDRARLNDGWLFLLPANWTEGTVALELQVDPRKQHTDPNLANNTLSRSISFQAQPPVCVWTVPVRTHTPMPSVNDPNFWSMVDHFKRRWPVPDAWIYRDTEQVEELEVCWYGPVPYPCFGPYELEDGWGLTNGIPDRDKVIVSLWTRAQLSFNPDACDDIGAPVHFMGIVHPDANNGGASGYASTVSNQSWVQLPEHTPNPIPPGWNSLREGSVMAQELAHNYGRKHVNCNNPDDIDGSYPYPPCQIANTGADSYYGFDVTTRQPIRPDQTADFMSYANRSWVSDYTWRALLNSFASVSTASAAPAGIDAGNSVFVSGLVDTGAARGEIASVLVLPSASLPPATLQSQQVQTAGADHGGIAHAAYALRLLDSAGTILWEQPLTPLVMDDHVSDSASALFSAVFPQPAGQVATIQLLADATVLDIVTPGINPPSVAIQQPTVWAMIDAALTIQWSASDPDPADRLLFTIQYSHNSGAAWHTLTSNYPSTPAGQYTLILNDLGSLHGSAPNAALLRVLASDGYNTSIATSQPFTVKNRKPYPYIVTPESGQTYPAGQAIMLSGGATDAEDGGLAGDSLRWAVDGTNAGSGAETIAAGLAPGTHTAVMTATDSIGNVASASTSFDVAPLAIPLVAAPVLDGACDDSSYGAGVQVQLAPYSSAQATVHMARSSDQLWACFVGMEKGATTPGAFAGLRVDVDNSRNELAQTGDFGFFVGEDGDVFTTAGDGAGGFAAAGPGGLQAQVSIQPNTWSAELRIDKNVLGGWDHLVGLSAGHYWRNFQGEDFVWPYTALWNKPGSWAITALGDQPVIAAFDPYAATVGGPAFTLSVEGSGFVSGTTVLWGGIELPTSVVDGEHLTAAVGAAQLGGAGQIQVSVRSPAPGNFASNRLYFLVDVVTPLITGLTPAGIGADSPALQLTIDGSNFAADAQVLWNGAPLVTQFVSASQVKAQIDAALLSVGQTAGVAVRNQSPVERISPSYPLVVGPAASQQRVFLPLVNR